MHIILFLLAVIMIIVLIWPKKKLRRSIKLSDRLNSILSKLHYDEDSNNYKVLQQKINNAGINISPETFQSIRIIFPFMTTAFYILLNVINYVNLHLNIDAVKEAAKLLNDQSILNIRLNIDIRVILVIYLISILLPGLILKFMSSTRIKLSQKESLTLLTYTVMLLRTPKPVKDILNSIYERADYFKLILERANNTFSTDSKKALDELMNSAPDKTEFENICIALQEAQNGDRRLSIVYLENHRNLAREVNKQIRIRKQTRNQGIGILAMMIPIAISIAIVGYPWLIYTIRAISSIPI
ncbi:hypothetical protein RBQ61_02790 [Sedimentibacter sp. MB35-C1]|uniref:hypothetical protein n=1 Tax=Sedimentibacter sp. MB35-C1 TaxID=3070995 RepID=UPI0027DF2EAD|nr:hypothetical protein [Sedimentibacter sp. MB35-C1]WMJ77872.1 hypothetical protein RBQ61_02790 [Sedimentibacter sp. MB35-C1]